MSAYYDISGSPLGPIFIGGSAAGLYRIDFIDGPGGRRTEARCLALLADEARAAPRKDAGATAPAAEQLTEYFAGRRTEFDLPLAPRGTAFQLAVWKALLGISYGETASYGAIARAIGRPGASRAVGAATGRNPLSLVVPCHRVVGADGTLTGYGGGLDRKAWLLDLEARALRAPRRDILSAAFA